MCATRQTQGAPHEYPYCATLCIRGIVAFVSRSRKNQNTQHEQVLYSPHDVAVQLGISTAALRRLAQAYERTFGSLARDSRFGRVWPQEALERLKRARMAVKDGQYRSVELALRAIAARGNIDAISISERVSTPEDAGQQLLKEIRGLREAIDRQNQLIEYQWRRTGALDAVVKVESPPSSEKMSVETANYGHEVVAEPSEDEKKERTKIVAATSVEKASENAKAAVLNAILTELAPPKLSVWQYGAGILLTLAAVFWDEVLSSQFVASSSYVVIAALPLSAIVPLIFGFWTGLAQGFVRLHWPTVGAVALVLVIGAVSLPVAMNNVIETPYRAFIWRPKILYP